MNYRHIYHAGSFADVVKHFILTILLEGLKRKENGFVYIDTHAGIGLYDLENPDALKTDEATQGIQKLLAQTTIPTIFTDYISTIKKLNNELGYNEISPLRFYPGSILIAKKLLRPQDRMIINELHPEDFLALKRNFKDDTQVACHKRNAYEFLPAILPPELKRGLVLIDPSFEEKDEFESILTVLKKSLAKWPTGIYAIWFPLKTESIQAFYDGLAEITHLPILTTELTIKNPDKLGLLGTGLTIINPPWQIEEKITTGLAYLWQLFNWENEGKCLVKMLQEKN